MKNSKSKNKKHLSLIALGIVIGVVTIFAVGAAVYQFSGRDMKGKIRYVISKAKENVKLYSQKTISNIPKRVGNRDDEKGGILYLNIDVNNSIRTINPMIYGSNLTSKTEFQMDVAKFGKDIGITNVRFPGGDSIGYRWKLASYDFEDRYDQAPLANIENVIKFCKIMNTQLVIQVNVESGTSQEAAEWVYFMNKGSKGMRVDYWELGNEVYGGWDKAYMPGEDYVKVIKAYTAAMRRVDPTIKIGANWGGPKYQEFDKAVMQGAADYIDFVSFHWYPNHINNSHKYKGRYHPLSKEIMANSLAVGKMVERLEQMILKFAPHRKDKIEFTVMEWDGSWDAVPSDLEYEYRGIMWSLANAIFYADALGQFAQHGITVANQYAFQEVMFGLIRGWDIDAGWGGSRWDGETVRPKALALQLFAKHFGDTLIESSLTGSPSYYKEADWRPDSYIGEVPYVTGYASKFSNDNVLAIALINKHSERNFKINITIKGINANQNGEVWILNGPSLEAQNDGSPEVVKIKKYSFSLTDVQNKFSYDIPAHSVNLLKIPLEGEFGAIDD